MRDRRCRRWRVLAGHGERECECEDGERQPTHVAGRCNTPEPPSGQDQRVVCAGGGEGGTPEEGRWEPASTAGGGRRRRRTLRTIPSARNSAPPIAEPVACARSIELAVPRVTSVQLHIALPVPGVLYQTRYPGAKSDATTMPRRSPARTNVNSRLTTSMRSPRRLERNACCRRHLCSLACARHHVRNLS